MLQQHAVLQVTIRLDPIPGINHTSEDVENWLRLRLAAILPHYNPTVKLLYTVQTEGIGFEEGSPKVVEVTTKQTLACHAPNCELIFKAINGENIANQRIIHPYGSKGGYNYMHVIEVTPGEFYSAQIVEDWEKQKQEEIDAVSRVMNICPTCKVVAGCSTPISCDDVWHVRNDESAYYVNNETLKERTESAIESQADTDVQKEVELMSRRNRKDEDVLPEYMGHGIAKIRNRRRG